jgi:hypothetical protein
MDKKQYISLFVGVIATSLLTQGIFAYALQSQVAPVVPLATPKTSPTPVIAPSAPTLQPVFEQALFDYLWKKTFHYTTFFESLEGFHRAGNASVDGNQLILSTGESANSFAQVFKQPEWQGILSFGERSAFRTSVTINNPKEMTAYITVGLHGTNGYGFKIDNGTLYGVTHNDTTEEVVRLTPLNSGVYNISARLEPKSSVSFYVNDAKLGSITKTIPTQKLAPFLQIMDIYLLTKEPLQKSLQLSFFDYMQTRGLGK